ncbi:MAG: ArsC/Spx/MgsR family protein [Flavobacteriales bacterium]
MRVMHENPQLIERPVVVKGHTAAIGRPMENVKDLIDKK